LFPPKVSKQQRTKFSIPNTTIHEESIENNETESKNFGPDTNLNPTNTPNRVYIQQSA